MTKNLRHILRGHRPHRVIGYPAVVRPLAVTAGVRFLREGVDIGSPVIWGVCSCVDWVTWPCVG